MCHRASQLRATFTICFGAACGSNKFTFALVMSSKYCSCFVFRCANLICNLRGTRRSFTLYVVFQCNGTHWVSPGPTKLCGSTLPSILLYGVHPWMQHISHLWSNHKHWDALQRCSGCCLTFCACAFHQTLKTLLNQPPAILSTLHSSLTSNRAPNLWHYCYSFTKPWAKWQPLT
jgi:hypothetical protein